MKLLFDQNLSPQLVNRLADLYPDSQHVSFIELDQADDRTLWEYANQNDFTVVTRDSDFSELSLLRGSPPKVIWIRRGNCSMRQIEEILRSHYQNIIQFNEAPDLGVLALY
jgi:predicted nuclease of predicted toxin-antitoxin system